MPQKAAGIRTEPPVSLPIEAEPMPQATATAEPLDEPGLARRIVRILHVAGPGVLAGRTKRDFMHIRLGEHKCASRLQSIDHLRLAPQRRQGGPGPRQGFCATQVEQILDADEHSLQRARRQGLGTEIGDGGLRSIGFAGGALPIYPGDGIEVGMRLSPRLDQGELVTQDASAIEQLLDLESDRSRGRRLEGHVRLQ